MNYYGAFYRSALYPLLERINAYLLRWVRRKYKRLRGASSTTAIGRASARSCNIFSTGSVPVTDIRYSDASISPET